MSRDDPRERYWRGNLLGASSAAFAVSFGANIANPFLPLFLNRDLGVTNPGELALWTGSIAASTQILLALTSPVWGVVSDRFGRRAMLLRAVIGAGVGTAATIFVQTPLQLAGMRSFVGATAGVNAGTIALVAAETPPRHLGSALGIQNSARALGATVGPALGGFVGTVLPLRWVFFLSGLVELLAVGPLLLAVHETTAPERGAARPPLRAALAGLPRGARRAIGATIAAQALVQLALAAASQLVVLRLIELEPGSAALGAGLAFTALSLATVAAAVVLPRGLSRSGFRPLAVVCCVLLTAAMVGTAAAGAPALVIVGAAALGAATGGLNPILASMVGLETPAALQGTVFGLGSSAMSLGMAAGALAAGVLAAALGPASALVVCALVAVAAALTLRLWGREPRIAAPGGRGTIVAVGS